MAELTRRELIESGAIGVLAAAAPLNSASAYGQMEQTPLAPLKSVRERLLLDFNWRFALGHANDVERDFGFGAEQRTYAKAGTRVAAAAVEDFDDGAWRAIRLPHDWAVELPFAPTPNLQPNAEEDPRAAHGFKPLGRDYPDTSVGWYRRVFDLPQEDLGKRISIEFDGAFRDAIVMFNGYVVARNESGYAPFRCDVTDFVNYNGRNVLVVRVDAALGEGWFYEGAGVYRHVWLVKTHPLHVPQWGVFVRAESSAGGAELVIATELANEGERARRCEIASSVLDAEGRAVAQARAAAEIPAWSAQTTEQRARMERAQLWSIEAPYLYRLRTDILLDGAVIDSVVTPFGVRSIRFDAERGFFLNGAPVKLKGVCCHQDHAGVGAALPDALQVFRVRKLKEMGANAYRTAHNPPTPELLDACDRLGMVVIDETRPMSSHPEGLSQLERLVRRDRNHPSVILWSIGNEEQAQQATERGARIARTMKRLVNRLDPTRLVTAAMDSGFGEGIARVVDVLGFNYRTHLMEDYHRRFPDQPILGSETGSTVSTRGAYVRDDARYIVPAYDREHPWWATTAEFWWRIVAERPYLAGGFIWTGFDYRGEPTPFNRWPSNSSYFGAMDLCGFPKDNFYYYQAWWRSEPVLHLFPHWNWAGREGEEIEVWCHTNLDRVELFLNGSSLGAREIPRNSHAEWRVPYAPGVLEARGYKNGRLALTRRRETAGAPARIVLHADRAELAADGEDAAVITVEVQDARGRFVPTADNPIRFAHSGPGALIGVGNGDPTSLEADKGDRRRAFNGLAMAIVQAEPRPGEILVRATSPGLSEGRLRLQARRSRARAAAP